MSGAEVYVAMYRRFCLARKWQYATAWSDAADEIAFREELAGNAEKFWSEVDHLEKENK